MNNDPNYCKWFLKKWGNSPKKEHERQEREGDHRASRSDYGISVPQAKAKPTNTGGKSSTMTPIDLDTEVDVEEWWIWSRPPLNKSR